ncbi:protein phosphatase [Streptomyces sp. NPDC005566]|uniref:protein-tyrosine phosphatase family protein n=1 Tax=Streptomyces sp. NPDC005566 TaxID=3156886 RepID=UPI0033AB4898
MPEPHAPWNEVVPGLWMGGHHWTDASGERRPVIVGTEFGLVISLYTRPGHGPDPSVDHLVAEIPDGPLVAAQIHSVQQLAHTAARSVKEGRTVLVRCNAGYNRSGLVIAQTLIELGHEAPTAIHTVRQRRSPSALNNRLFEEYLNAGLGVAHLLADLETLS